MPETETILRDVASEEWRSEWFSDEAITQGLVLKYLSAFCKPRLQSARKIAMDIAGQHPQSIEGAASALLGLDAAVRNLSLSINCRQRLERKIQQLIDYLILRRSDHHWSGDLVGVFGFGRRYADPIFATALALEALATQI